MTRERRIGWVLLAALVMATAAAAQSQTDPGDPEALDMKLSKQTGYYVFQETVGRVTVIAGGQLAGLEESQPYVPFQIVVAVAGKGPELNLSRLNFELHDAYGQVHQTVDATKVQDGINSFVQDWVQENPLDLGSEFDTYSQVESDFYPVTQGGITDVNLDREEYIVDVVYFPKPEDLHGELMLSFWTEGMTEGAVNVRFTALLPKEKKKEEKKHHKGDS